MRVILRAIDVFFCREGMRRIVALSFLVLVCLSSCTFDNEEDLEVVVPGGISREEQVISFQQNVRPILNTKCSISGCHIAGTSLPDYSIDDKVKAEAEFIKREVLSGNMPRRVGISFEEKDILISWINQGAELD